MNEGLGPAYDDNEFRRLADELPHIIWVSDADGRLLYANKRFGVAILHEDDRDRVRALPRHPLGSESPAQALVRIRPMGGPADAWQWHVVQAVPLFGHFGHGVEWAFTATDINERYQHEQSLRESEAVLTQIFETSEDSIKLLNLEGEMLYVSASSRRMLQIDASAMRGRSWFDLWQGEEREKARAAVEKARNGISSDFVGTRRTAGDLETFWHAIVSPILDDSGRPVRVLVMSRDTTRQVQSEASAREREAQLRTMTDLLPVLIWSASGDGKIEFVNRRFLEYTGLSFETIMSGGGWLEAIHPDDRERVAELWRESIASEKNYETEMRMRRYDGEYRWHESRAVPIRAAGRVVRWLGTTTDVEERKRAEGVQSYLATASTSLLKALDFEETLDALLAIVVPASADWAVINVAEGDGIRAVAVRHADPARAYAVRQLRGSQYVRAEANVGTPGVFKTGKPAVIPKIDDAFTQALVRPQFLNAVRAMGLHSGLVVPLRSQDRVIGTLTLVSESPKREYSEDDVPLFEELASRASLAVEHAQLFERERLVADTLQSASLPATLPQMEGVRFDAVYMPASSEAQIGGDWYDAFQLDDGRVFVSIGDVVGHGLSAAVTMNMLRQSMRTAALIDPDPYFVLSVADRALRAENNEAMATAVVAVIDPAARRMNCASAGHPGPFWYRGGGDVEEPTIDRGLPLGIHAGVENSGPIVIDGVEFVTFFTDGLVESSHNYAEGETQLRAALAMESVRNSAHPAHAIRRRMLPDGSRDDVAILTVSFARAGDRRRVVRGNVDLASLLNRPL
jgi:PAS domain S-box-containing protein